MTKSILFKIKLAGKGGVNYDSNEQKYYFNRQVSVPFVKHDNVNLHKGRFYSTGTTTEKGVDLLVKKWSISSDCMFRAMFADTQTSANVNIMHDESTFLKYIASPTAIIKGYMFTDHNLKRKSAITLTDAEQCNNAIPTIEVFSRSGPKASQTEVGDKADNTFFFKETIGEIEYEARGAINLDELRFIPMSEVHGRLAVNPDMYDIYSKYLSNHLGAIPAPGYYHKSTYDEFPEFGILLTDAQTIKLAHEIIKRLAFINIDKRTAYTHSESIMVKIVNEPLFDTMSSDDDWVTVKSKTERFDLSKVNITPSTSYVLVDEAVAKEQIKAIDELVKLAKKKPVKAPKTKPESDE